MRLDQISRLFVVALALAGVACQQTPEARAAAFVERAKTFVAEKEYARALIEYANATQATPKDPDPHYQMAKIYMEMRQFDQAVAKFNEALKLNPGHNEAKVALAALKSLTVDPELQKQAAEEARQAIESGTPTAESLDAVAFVEMNAGDSAGAMAHLEDAISQFPKNANSWVMLATAKLATRDLPGAEEVIRKAATANPDSAGLALAAGRLYAIMKKPAESEAWIRRAVDLDPKSGPALLDLGALLMAGRRQPEAEATYRRVTTLGGKYSTIYAMYLLSQRNYEEAVPEWEKLYRAEPLNREIRKHLIATYLVAGRHAEGLKVMDSVIKNNPKDADMLLQRGEFNLEALKLVEAEEDLTRAGQFLQDSGVFHFAMGRLHAAKGATDRQIDEFQQAVRLRPDLLGARVALIKSLRAKGGNGVFDVINATPPAQQNTLAITIQKTWALIEKKDFDGARAAVAANLKDRRIPEVLLQDAAIRAGKGDLVGAIEPLKEALRMDPENLRALELLAETHVARKSPEQALAALQEHAAKVPNSQQVQFFVGQWMSRAGRNDFARRYYEATARLNPGSVRPTLALAQLDMSDGKFDQAKKKLDEVTATGKGGTLAEFLKGDLAQKKGDLTAAVEHYRKAVEMDPSNVAGLNNLAMILVDTLHQTDEALALAQKAYELAPGNPAVQDTIGWVYFNRKDYQTALQHIEKAAQTSTLPSIRYHLAIVYYRAGQTKKGISLFDETFRTAPNSPEARLAVSVFNGGSAR